MTKKIPLGFHKNLHALLFIKCFSLTLPSGWKTQKKEQASITCSSIVVIIIVILYVIYLHSAKTIFSRVRVGIFASKYLRILLLLTVSQVILDSGYHPRNQLIKFELLTQSIMWCLPPGNCPACPYGLTFRNCLWMWANICMKTIVSFHTKDENNISSELLSIPFSIFCTVFTRFLYFLHLSGKTMSIF